MADNVKIYTSEDMKFDKLSREHLVLVDFWAAWCGPCRMVAPVVEALADEVKDVTFAKVNVDENYDLAMGLGISAIPTLILFKEGTAVDRAVGVQDKKDLLAMIDRNR